MLRARLHGGLTVWVDGRRLPEIGGTRPRSLLAYLLLHPGRHARARVAGVFWPDVLDTSARASLRSALWAVRASLDAVGGAAFLEADRTAVGIRTGDDLVVDALEIPVLIAAGDRASLRRALDIAAEPLLPEIADEWALEAQDRERDRLIEAHLALASMAEAEGDVDEAVSCTRAALGRDRLRESTYRDLMRRLFAAGDRAGALAAYRRCADTLAGELGVPPSAATRALADEIRTGAVSSGAPAGPAPGTAARSAAPARTGPRLPVRDGATVGRGAELTRLGTAWRHAVAGAGGVALVVGAAGVGKSRLAGQVMADAAAQGAVTVVGHAVDIDGAPPFAPWAEALRGLVRATPAPAGPAGWPAELARLCPAVESAWGYAPGGAPHEPSLGRTRLFEAVAEALDWCASSAPCAVLLEDMHLAGAESLALLVHVAPRLARTPMLIVVTARARAVPGALDRARMALASRGVLRDEVHLAALAPDETLALVARAAPSLAPGIARRVAEVSRGNPLMALSAARRAADGDDPEAALRDAVRVPMAGLSPAAARLVAVAAAAGRGLGLAEAAGISGGRDLDAAVAEGVAAGLLDPGDAPRVGFVHDLVRDACYDALTGPERRAAHARMAGVLMGTGSRGAAEVAHHLGRAGDGERARAYLIAAAASARALGALDQAAGHLRDAAASAVAAGDAAAEGEAWMTLAEVEAWRGDRPSLDAAFGRGRAALERAGDAVALASALAERARWFRTTTCYPEEVSRSSREALDILELAGADAPETRLLALAGMAWGEAVSGDPLRAAALQERLGLLLESDGDAVLRSEHLAARGYALLRAGDAAAAREACAAAAAVADAAGSAAQALDARIGEAACVAALGDIDEVLDVLRDAPDPVLTGPGLACQHWAARAHAYSRLGRHAEAEEAAHHQVQIARRAVNPEFEGAAGADLGVVLLAAGDGARALPVLEAVLGDGAARVPRAALRLHAVEAALLAGDLARAHAHLEAFPFDPVRPGDDPATLVARVDRITGLVRMADGDPVAAIGHLDAAGARWRRLGRRQGPSGAAGDAIVGSMIDLGRPPVAGLVDIDAELARVEHERRRARAMVAIPGAEQV